MECDNYNECHDLDVIAEDDNGLRVHCKICKNQYMIRKDERGVPEKREYARLFKRFILQGNDNLFYRYNERFLLK